MYNFHPDKLTKYSKHYTQEALWKKIRRFTERQGRKPVYYALQLYYILQDKSVSKSDKATILGALGYFILPLDLLPDITPIIGFTDDIAALIACTKSIIANCTPEVKERAEQKVNEWFGKIELND